MKIEDDRRLTMARQRPLSLEIKRLREELDKLRLLVYSNEYDIKQLSESVQADRRRNLRKGDG